MSKHELQVCIECKHPSLIGRWFDKPGGAALFNELNDVVTALGYDKTVLVRPVACLGNCNSRCRISVIGKKRWTWIFGDVLPVKDKLEIINFLELWLLSENGLIAKTSRSDWVKKKSLGRVPPEQL